MMLEILFGWQKASRCKELIRHVRCRLKLLQNKRDAIVSHLRTDIAQLLKSGYQESAYFRVEQLFKDQSILAAYDLLDHFCEFIFINLPYIRRHRDCPNDIKEAISSLIFASARCADLPELQTLRKLFGKRYGNDFTVAAVELFPGSLVNRQLREKLCTRSISDDEKIKLIEEIATEYNIQLGQPEIENRGNIQHWNVHINEGLICNPSYEQGKEVLDEGIEVVYSDIQRAEMEASNDKKMLRLSNKKKASKTDPLKAKERSHNSLLNGKEARAHSFQYQLSSENTSNLGADNIVRQHAPDIVQLNPPTIHKKLDDEEKLEKLESQSVRESNQEIPCLTELSDTSMLHNVDRSETESSTQLLESIIVCLDDLDDFRLSRQERNKGKHEKCPVREKGQERLKSKDASARKSIQPRNDIGSVGLCGKGRNATRYGTYCQRTSSVHNTILSDAADYDPLTKNYTELSALQDEIISIDCSSKRKNSEERRSKKRSLSGRSQPRNSCADTDHPQFDDFLGKSRSLSPQTHSLRHDSSMSVAFSVNESECALYYDKGRDYSGSNPLEFHWDRANASGILSSHGCHCSSVSNSDAQISISGEFTHTCRCMVTDKREHWKEKASEGSRTITFRGGHGNKPLPPSSQQSYCGVQEKLAKEMGNSHRCKFNMGSGSGYSCSSHDIDMVPDCSLDHPCYFLASDEKDDWRSPSKGSSAVACEGKNCCGFKQDQEENTSILQPPYHHHVSNSTALGCNDGDNDVQEPIVVTPQREQSADLDFKGTSRTNSQGCVVNATSSHDSTGLQIKNGEGSSDPHSSSSGTSCRSSSYSRDILNTTSRPPYLRSMTMPPPERSNFTTRDQGLRSTSFQFQQHKQPSGHVHPKLPDYDDLTAKFTALKKEHLQSSILQVGYA